MLRIYRSCEFFSRSTVVFGISRESAFICHGSRSPTITPPWVNTFVTIGRASASVEVFCSQRPEVVLAVTHAPADGNLERAYLQLPAVDFSHDVLTHQSHTLLVLRDPTSGWADLGSPARVLATLARNDIKPKWAADQDGLTFNVNERPEFANDSRDAD
jgi:hypothetical protein